MSRSHSFARTLRPGSPAPSTARLQKHAEGRFQSVADLASALEPFGAPEARDMAGRVRTILSTRNRSPSLPEMSIPSSRVAVTGGTSVSWGDTQLAPLRRGRTRVISTIAIAAGALGIVPAIAGWRSQGPSSGVSTVPSAHAAVAGGTASSPPATTAALPDPAAPPAETLAATAPAPSSGHATTAPHGPTSRPPPSSVPVVPTTTHPATVATGTPPVPTATAKPATELPNERESPFLVRWPRA